MNQTTTAVGVVFDLQRTAIEGTHEAVRRGIRSQQEFGEALVDFGPATQANERGYEAVRTVVDAYFDSVEAVTPGQQDLLADVRAAVDEQLDALEASHVEAVETVEANVQEEGEIAAELGAELVAVLDEQFEAVLSAHEDVEAQTLEAVEGFEAQLEAFEAQVEDVREQVEDATDELVDASDEVAETARQQVTAQVEAASEALQAIDGLGSTYAGRLQDQGIESLEALAEANADLVAEAADVSRQQAETWIEAARSST